MAKKKHKTRTDPDADLTPKMRAFLAAYSETGSIPAAAQIAGCERSTHRTSWMQNEDYRKAFAAAKEEAIDVLETEAIRRATRGTDRPVFHKGKPCGTIREYSDILLIFLLKAARPEKYRDNHKVEHSGEIRHVKLYAHEAPVDRV